MQLSIISTLYQSEHYILDFHNRISAVAKQWVGEDYEIILVNDGSPDRSLEIAIQLTEQDSHVTLIDLSRNFGHHKAIMTGLAAAQGQQVFLIDSDLEEKPEWLTAFATKMAQENCDVVYGVQAERKGGWFEKISGWFFYRIFRLITGVLQPNNIMTVRLMSRPYVNALLLFQERELNIGGLWAITGFKQCSYTAQKSASSPTTYNFSRKFEHVINAITSFSGRPLVFIFYSGFVLLATAVGFMIYRIGMYYLIATPVDGYTSLIASIWFFSGLIIFLLGLQSIYISKIFSEVKQRPQTIRSHDA